jgi:hypothetical protein
MSAPYPEAFERKWPGGWPEFQARSSRYLALYNTVLSGSLKRFVESLGRIPSTLGDLCDSGATALRCPDWLNPFTGKPFTEGFPGEVGAVYLKPLSTTKGRFGVVLAGTFLDPISGESYTAEEEWIEDSSRMRALTVGGVVSREDAKALSLRAVSETLESVFDIPCARSAASWDKLVAQLPFLSRLRNDFTGGYARLVWEHHLPASGADLEKARLRRSARGTPGDLVVVWSPNEVEAWVVDAEGVVGE